MEDGNRTGDLDMEVEMEMGNVESTRRLVRGVSLHVVAPTKKEPQGTTAISLNVEGTGGEGEGKKGDMDSSNALIASLFALAFSCSNVFLYNHVHSHVLLHVHVANRRLFAASAHTHARPTLH